MGVSYPRKCLGSMLEQTKGVFWMLVFKVRSPLVSDSVN